MTVRYCSIVSGVEFLLSYIAEIQDVVGNPRLDLFPFLPSTSLTVSWTTPLLLSVRTFMSSSKIFRPASLLPIIALAI